MKQNIIVIILLQILNISLYASAQSIATSSSIVENDQLTKRILYNASENKTLYAAWCQITNTSTGALSIVNEVQNVSSHTAEVLTQPSEDDIGENLRLVLGFNTEAMKTRERSHILLAKIDSPSLKVMKVEELASEEKYLVFSSTRTSIAPDYSPETLVVSVTNITHTTFYCAAYTTDPKGVMQASRIGTGVATLDPHQTHLISFEDKDKKENLCFCISDDPDNLETKLNNKQLTDLRPIVISSSTKGKTKKDAVKSDKEFFIVPPIMGAKKTALTDEGRNFTIIGSSEISRPLFLIDQLVKRYHPLPELTKSAKAKYDKKIKDKINDHDKNITTETEVSTPIKLKSTALPDIEEEKEFVERRKKVVKKGLKKLFEEEINSKSFPDFPDIQAEDFERDEYLPSIAFVSTGGGYRAMVETIGFLEGAQDTDILNCCMYMCGLSGSTWAINSLVASKQPSISKFADTFKKKVTKETTQVTEDGTLARALKKLVNLGLLAEENPFYGLFKLIFALSDSEGYKLCKYIQELYGQEQGFVGLYGHALVEALLNDAKINGKKSAHSIMLSDLCAALDTIEPIYPLPISVCLHSPEDANSKDSQWVEFTPYTVGMYDMNDKYVLWHIPTYTFGSYYLEDSLVHRVPEYTLGQLFGIFGSAMGISDATLEDHKKMGARSLLKIIQDLKSNGIGIEFDEKRMTAGVVPNFLYQGEQQSPKTKHKNFYTKNLTLVDGGMLSTQDERGTNCHNFATMPAVQRKCDVLILVDCSARSNEENNKRHLKAFYEFTAEQGFPLPEITDFETMNTKSALLHDKALKTPSFIYILGQRHDEAVERFETDSSANNKTATAYFGFSEETYTGLRTVAKELFKRQKNITNIKKAILISMSKKKKSLPASQPVVNTSKPTSAAPLPVAVNSDQYENDSSAEEQTSTSQNVDNKPQKKGSDKKKKENSHRQKDSKSKSSDIVSPKQNLQKSNVESVDRDDSSDTDDTSKMKASHRNKLKKKSGASKSSKATSTASVALATPAQNSNFDTFKETFPHYETDQLGAVKDTILTLTKDLRYEFFADFISYAAKNNSIDLLKFIIEKADAASNRPTDIKKIYAIAKQEIMVVGAQDDIIYCRSNSSNPLHEAAENTNKEMFKLLLNKNIFALGYTNEQKETPLHTASRLKAQGCVEEALRFFEEIDSITIDRKDHTEMLQNLVRQIFTTEDNAQNTVADNTEDPAIKKRIRRILIKYYISSGL